jgi:hypothetical protein
LQDKILLDLVCVVDTILERYESVDSLTGELVVDANYGGLSNGVCDAVSVSVVIVCSKDLRCSMRAASISAVDNLWPDTLTTSSTRPRIQ